MSFSANWTPRIVRPDNESRSANWTPRIVRPDNESRSANWTPRIVRPDNESRSANWTPRIVRPDSESRSYDLLRKFDEIVDPVLRSERRARDTIQSYRRYVLAWCKYWENRYLEDGTTCPVLQEVTRQHLVAWRDSLIAQGNTARNCNKYVGGVCTILKLIAERTPDRVSADVPRLKALKTNAAAAKLYLRYLGPSEQKRLDELIAKSQLGTEDLVALDELRRSDELSRLYQACSIATWPTRSAHGRRLEPVMQWRAAIVLFLTYGFRTEDLIRYTPGESLAWHQIHWSQETPSAEGHGRNEHGWLFYTPEKTAGTSGELLVLPLSAVAAAHLRAICPHKPSERERVFPWPMCSKLLYRQWNRIVAAAGLRTKYDLRTGHAITRQIKHLRKTCATWCEHYQPGSSSLILGHARRDVAAVTAKHYINSELFLIGVVNAMPIPEAWRSIFALPTTQLRLF